MQRHHVGSLRSTPAVGTTVRARSHRPSLRAAIAVAVAAIAITGCSPAFWGGAALGAVGASAAYERENRRALDRLERAFERGDISKREYLKRRKEIEDQSVVR